MRERLIELLNEAKDLPCGNGSPWEYDFCKGCEYETETYCHTKREVDHLLANGVVLVDAEKVNVVSNREPIVTAFNMPLDELAELVRAKEEGRIIVPPCKVGDKVYRVSTKNISKLKYIEETTISRIAIDDDGVWLFCKCNPTARCVYGKTVFPTKEEAEQALRKDEGK